MTARAHNGQPTPTWRKWFNGCRWSWRYLTTNRSSFEAWGADAVSFIAGFLSRSNRPGYEKRPHVQPDAARGKSGRRRACSGGRRGGRSLLPLAGHLRGLSLVDLGVVVMVEALVDDLAPVGVEVELGGVVLVVTADAEPVAV